MVILMKFLRLRMNKQKSEKFLGISILGNLQAFMNFTPRKLINPSGWSSENAPSWILQEERVIPYWRSSSLIPQALLAFLSHLRKEKTKTLNAVKLD